VSDAGVPGVAILGIDAAEAFSKLFQIVCDRQVRDEFSSASGKTQLREHARHPAWLLRSNLDDPRKIPYLLAWKDERHDGKIMEGVRLAHDGFHRGPLALRVGADSKHS
jgi:hypothetical protein